MSLVLDASMALAWCFEGEQTPPVLGVLDRVVESGAIAPLLWPLEVLNGLYSAERGQCLEPGRRVRLAAFLRELPIRLDRETAEQAWEDTAKIAEAFGLTVYDAAYLELARRRRLPLASLDEALRKAAVSVGVEVLGRAP